MTGRVALKTERSWGEEGSRTQKMPCLMWPVIQLFPLSSLILVSTRSHEGRLTGSHIGHLKIVASGNMLPSTLISGWLTCCSIEAFIFIICILTSPIENLENFNIHEYLLIQILPHPAPQRYLVAEISTGEWGCLRKSIPFEGILSLSLGLMRCAFGAGVWKTR